MTLKKLIADLAEDCRLEPATVEDVLLALSGMAEETLRKGEKFPVGNLGSLYLTARENSKNRTRLPAVQFESSTQTRTNLKAGNVQFFKPESDICPECQERQVRKDRLCPTCGARARRAKMKEKGIDTLTGSLSGKRAKQARHYFFQTLMVSRPQKGK